MKGRGAEGEKRLGEPEFENRGEGEVCYSGNGCFCDVVVEK